MFSLRPIAQLTFPTIGEKIKETETNEATKKEMKKEENGKERKWLNTERKIEKMREKGGQDKGREENS